VEIFGSRKQILKAPAVAMPWVFSIGHKGYVGTGRSYDGGYNYYKDFWEYDPVVNKWTQRADFGGTVRSEAVGFGIGHKGYLGTGYYSDQVSHSYNDFWEYDPIENSWTQKSNFGGAVLSRCCWL
jgi:N-acetylneuraminic acid mutarotase